MAENFDPYRKWLGISPKDQPPNHYRLLGIELFDDDPDVIEAAADQRMGHVRTYQTGQNSALSQKILNELSAAKICLLDQGKKAAYDDKLRRELAAKQPAGGTTPGITGVDLAVVPLAELDTESTAIEPALHSHSHVPHTSAKWRARRPAWLLPAAVAAAILLAAAPLAWIVISSRHEVAPKATKTLAGQAGTLNRSENAATTQPIQRGADSRPTAATPAVTDAQRREAASEPPRIANMDRQIAEEVLRRGGQLRVMVNGQSVGVDRLGALPKSEFEVVQVSILHAAADMVADLTFLAGAKSLELLALADSRITTASLLPLAGHPRLRNLNLEDTRLPTRSIKALLPLPELESLLLAGCEISAQDLRDIATLKKLRVLGIQGAKINGDDMRLFSQLPALQQVHLYNVPLNDQGLRTLVDSAPGLRLLVISGTKVTSDGLRHLAALKGLKILDIAGISMTGSNLRWLGELRELESLKLVGTAITDDSLVTVGQLATLKELLVSQNAISDAGLRHLASLSGLTSLEANDTNVTPAGIAELRKALPQCQIVSNAMLVAASGSAAAPLAAKPGDDSDGKRKSLAELVSDDGAVGASPRPPLPTGDAIAGARQLVEETYGKELAGDDKAAGVKTLLTAARSSGDLLAQAALLQAAADVAAKAGQLRLAFEALDELGQRFDFDPMRAKVEMLESAAKSARSTDQRVVLVSRALELIDEAAAVARFDDADHAVKVGQSIVGRLKDIDLRNEVAARRKDLQKRRKAHEAQEKELADARGALADNADDAAANETLGKYLCLHGDDWPAGLKHLAMAATARLRTAAEADRRGADGAVEQIAVGDLWWQLAEAARSAQEERGYRRRAAVWYGKALPGLTGLARTKAEERLNTAVDEASVSGGSEAGRGQPIELHLAPSVVLRLVHVPASEDGTIAAFHLAATETTEAQWFAVAGGQASAPDMPRADLVCDDCVRWIETLNRSSVGRRFTFRLPTRDELHHAWFAGLPPSYSPQQIREYAWISPSSGEVLHPVATRKRNNFGIYDLAGNCNEWITKSTLCGGAVDSPASIFESSFPCSGDETGRRNKFWGFRVAADLK